VAGAREENRRNICLYKLKIINSLTNREKTEFRREEGHWIEFKATSRVPMAQRRRTNCCMKILIADDDAVTLKLLHRILSAEPTYEIEGARDGQECWELLETGYKPDVCLLDIEMPRLSGLDLLERMRNSEEYESIPVLIVSSRADIDSQASAAALRSFAFVVKPFNSKRVLGLVSEALVSLRKSFEPYGFVSRKKILEKRSISSKQYLKQMVVFVRMLGSRMDSLSELVRDGNWREIEGSTGPLKRLAEFLGADSFTDYFNKIVRSMFEDHRGHLLRLRSEFEELKSLLESYLNVVIPTAANTQISTISHVGQGDSLGTIELQAKITDSAEFSHSRDLMLGQAILLNANRGGESIASARFEVLDGEVILKTTVEKPLGPGKGDYDLAITVSETLENAVHVIRASGVEAR